MVRYQLFVPSEMARRWTTKAADAFIRSMTLFLLLALHLTFAMVAVAQSENENESSGPVETSRVVARVGEVRITLSMVDKVVESTVGETAGLTEPEVRTARSAALMGLVRRELAMQRMLKLGGDSLQARVERAHQQALASLQRIDSNATLSDQDKSDIAFEVGWNEYLAKHLTDENLRRYFSANSYRYDGTKAQVAQIFLRRDWRPAESSEKDVLAAPGTLVDPSPAEKFLKSLSERVRAGELQFGDAARQYSQAPSGETGGDIGWVTGGADLPREVADLALKSQKGECVGPVSSHLGWHLLSIKEHQVGGVAYEDFADHSRLQRDAADYLFDRLVRDAANDDAVQWQDSELRPSPAELKRWLLKP